MSLTEYRAGSQICAENRPINHVMFITKGTAEASFCGRKYSYEQGDVLGICDLTAGMYSGTYTAATDITVFSYPFKNLSALESLLKERADVASLLVNSMSRQLVNILQYKIELKRESERAYDLATKLYPQYEELCADYAFTAKKLDEAVDIKPFSELDLIDEWVFTYYAGMKSLETGVRKDFFVGRPAITLGFIRKASEDALAAINICKDYIQYNKELSQIFLNSNGHDFFSIISELHFDAINLRGGDDAVSGLMSRILSLLSGLTGINKASYQKRLAAYNEVLAKKRENKTDITSPIVTGGEKKNLLDSMDVILKYSELPTETCSKFARAVMEYTNLSDRSCSEDAASRLRRQLTAHFYEIYTNVLIKSLKDPRPPTIINMFLNFGYVDADLAGHENADYLYSVADSVKGDLELGVYTAKDWFTAIYEGRKDPCRNELDDDYPAYIRRLRHERKIDENEEKRLLEDNEKKLRFELENVFPIASKITCGIISTFCPLFSSHNVQRKLETSLVTPALIKKHLDEVRSVDFSAFYRPTLFSHPDIGNNKETIHYEVLPDFILTPVLGIRGMAWQEIEGMNRQTPARMFLPVFMQSDFKPALVKLTADFRWEMCKRIQGVRWNDLSDLSLTSEYVDYLQFFRNNRSLTPDMKETVKSEFLRARSNYKTVFSLNYSDWMLYEASGSSRLNKVARAIIFFYCPFSREHREKLKQNPQFADAFKRFNVKYNQRLQHLERVITRITQSGKPVPQELLNERVYAGR